MHLKILFKIDFCVAVLILKIEENKQQLWHIMIYYFNKGKNTTKTHKNVQNVDKVLLLIECVKGGLRVLCLRFLVGQCSTVR